MMMFIDISSYVGHWPYRNLTYKNMEEYIITLEGEESENLKEFNNVLKLSKVQAGPYAYVKTWFLDNYANYSEQPEFDADGFVIVKTKSAKEAEAKAKAENKVEENENQAAEAVA